jgi:peroxiredoxin
MKKTIISIIILGLITILVFVINKGINIKVKTEERVSILEVNTSKMPLFEFRTLDSITFSKYNLTKNKATIMVYFDPDCNLCEKSGEVFNTFKSIHKTSNVLFVSHNTKEKIQAYQERFGLELISNIQFLQCNEDDFYNLFKESKTPTYFIYNTNQKLIKVINDDVPVKTILRYIKAAQIDS